MGERLPDGGVSGRLLEGGPNWQVCAAGAGGRSALLLRAGDDPAWWETEIKELASAAGRPFEEISGLRCLLCPAASQPRLIGKLGLRSPALSRIEAEALGGALAALGRRRPVAGWSSALFLPELAFALATADEPRDNRRAVLAAALSGGVRDAGLKPARIAQLNPRLDTATAAKVLELAGAALPAASPSPAPDGFHLPGQPALEALLREQVLDVLHRPADYARLGVPRPAGVLLAGPPGCGKSFAAGQLAAFLGWPLHEVSVAGVGSMWLHETSRKLSEAFDAAANTAPALVLLEELDALGKPRAGGFGPTVEEVGTLLRLVEQAPGRGLLVVGTTNRPDAIDPALRRRGRFDIVHIMDHPDEHATAAILRSLLQDRPHAEGLDVDGAARRLTRRPASDLVWVVNEAARFAVRGGRDSIDDLLLARAVSALGPAGHGTV